MGQSTSTSTSAGTGKERVTKIISYDRKNRTDKVRYVNLERLYTDLMYHMDCCMSRDDVPCVLAFRVVVGKWKALSRLLDKRPEHWWNVVAQQDDLLEQDWQLFADREGVVWADCKIAVESLTDLTTERIRGFALSAHQKICEEQEKRTGEKLRTLKLQPHTHAVFLIFEIKTE